jgi:hypothetical protein
MPKVNGGGKKKKKNMKGGDDFSDLNEYYNLLMKNNSGVWNRLRFMSRIENFLELLKKLLEENFNFSTVESYYEYFNKLKELFDKYTTLFRKIGGKIRMREDDSMYKLVTSVRGLFYERFIFLSNEILNKFVEEADKALRKIYNIKSPKYLVYGQRNNPQRTLKNGQNINVISPSSVNLTGRNAVNSISQQNKENIDNLAQLQGLLLANYSKYNPNKIEDSIIDKNFMSMQEIYIKYSAAVLLSNKRNMRISQ